MESNFTVREYVKADWPMVEAWWNAHTAERALIEAALPPVGVVVSRDGQPCASLWVHLSAGVGVAFLEAPVTLPGMSIIETKAAMSVALDAIESICLTHDYGLLVANTLPGIARWLERRRGFEPSGERVQLVRRLR